MAEIQGKKSLYIKINIYTLDDVGMSPDALLTLKPHPLDNPQSAQ